MVFLPVLSEIQYLNFLDFRNPWGKAMKRSGLRFDNFCSWRVENRRGKKKSFLRFFFPLCLTFFYPHFLKSNVQLFWFSESLEKRNEKKWSQIWKLMLIKGVILSCKKNMFFGEFCLTSRIFWYRCYYPHWSRDALSPVCGIFSLIYIQTLCLKIMNLSHIKPQWNTVALG